MIAILVESKTGKTGRRSLCQFRCRWFMIVCKQCFEGRCAGPTLVVRVRYRATAVAVVIELNVLAILGEHTQRALVTLDLSGHELEPGHGVEQLRQVSVNSNSLNIQRLNNQSFTINFTTINSFTINVSKIKVSKWTQQRSTVKVSTINSQIFNNKH